MTTDNFRFSLIRDNHTQISHIAGDLSMNTSPWNKDRIIGQKRPLQISHIWGIRIRLELEGKTRDLALFNMALDSKLRGCDLVKLKVSDVAYGSSVRRTKPYLIYKKTKNLRVIQLLLGHKKLDSTVRYLGIEVDDALEISESIEV